MTDEVVTRLYRCLVEELDRRGHPEGRPLKVSDLYQDLVPYRAVRSSLGVELNADYEHALLRLLSGERELLRLEPAQARDELRREVDAPYPFVGLFRKFSASNVWVNREDLSSRSQPPAPATAAAPPAGAGSSPSSGGRETAQPPRPTEHGEPSPEAVPALAASAEAAAPADPAPAVGGDSAPPREDGPGDAVPLRTPRSQGSLAPARLPVQLHREPDRKAAATEKLERGGVCTFCSEELPGGRRVRYCPHCGADQRMRPCPRCDAVLEQFWRYCISCGHETGSD